MPGLLAMQRLAGNRAVTALVQRSVTAEKFNIVGERHDESAATRAVEEKRYAEEKFSLDYWDEKGFVHDNVRGDDYYLSAIQDVVYVHKLARIAREYATEALELGETDQKRVQELLPAIPALLDKCAQFAMDLYNTRIQIAAKDKNFAAACARLPALVNSLKNRTGQSLHSAPAVDRDRRLKVLIASVPELMAAAEDAVRHVDDLAEVLGGDGGESSDPWLELEVQTSANRGQHMLKTANDAAAAGVTGLWKVGDDHIEEMRFFIEEDGAWCDASVVLTNRLEFNVEFTKWASGRQST
jgi:hypothetical protein